MSQTDEEKNQLELELAAAKSQAAELAGQVAGLSAENAALRLGHATQSKTAGAKDTAVAGASVLERAARRAAGSAHSRASVQEYMRVRRKF